MRSDIIMPVMPLTYGFFMFSFKAEVLLMD